MTAAHRIDPKPHGRRRETYVAPDLAQQLVSREGLRDLLDRIRADVSVPAWWLPAMVSISVVGTASGWATALLQR